LNPGGVAFSDASIAEMRNENGVTIQLDSTTEGLSVSVAASGVLISIAE
jgi:hypothetical protein